MSPIPNRSRFWQDHEREDLHTSRLSVGHGPCARFRGRGLFRTAGRVGYRHAPDWRFGAGSAGRNGPRRCGDRAARAPTHHRFVWRGLRAPCDRADAGAHGLETSGGSGPAGNPVHDHHSRFLGSECLCLAGRVHLCDARHSGAGQRHERIGGGDRPRDRPCDPASCAGPLGAGAHHRNRRPGDYRGSGRGDRCQCDRRALGAEPCRVLPEPGTRSRPRGHQDRGASRLRSPCGGAVSDRHGTVRAVRQRR